MPPVADPQIYNNFTAQGLVVLVVVAVLAGGFVLIRTLAASIKTLTGSLAQYLETATKTSQKVSATQTDILQVCGKLFEVVDKLEDKIRLDNALTLEAIGKISGNGEYAKIITSVEHTKKKVLEGQSALAEHITQRHLVTDHKIERLAGGPQWKNEDRT